MKKNIRKISLILSLVMIISLFSINKIIRAEEKKYLNYPTFELSELKSDRNEALAGEDIVISGTLTPKPFEINVESKDIVLVLDTSGSMAGNKLTQLKSAAKSFIDEVSKIDNVKVGIVQYSTLSTINPTSKSGEISYNSHDVKFTDQKVPNYQEATEDFFYANNPKLKTSINQLDAKGGTNIGEGLRKALYILNKDTGTKKENKFIVLMTDGLPTFYTVDISNNKNPYYEIDKKIVKDVKGAGSGYDPNSENYAKYMGKIIKEKSYNAYSVGYGLDTSGTNYLKNIHESMIKNKLSGSGLDNENNGFFSTSENAITSVFNKIARDIVEKYPIENVNLNLKFNEGFTLNVEGNQVNIGTIDYKKSLEIEDLEYGKTNNKIVYKAKPIDFYFIVRGTKIGENDIFYEIELEYLFDNKEYSNPFKSDISVNIKENEFPNISSELISSKLVKGKNGDEFTVRYKLKAEDFAFKRLSSINLTEIAIVIPTPNKLNNKDAFVNFINNTLLNTDHFKNEYSRIGLMTLEGGGKVYSNLLKNREGNSDNRNKLQNMVQSLFKSSSTSSNYYFGDMIDSLDTIFKDSRPYAKKTVIIMSRNNMNISDTNKYNEDLQTLKSKDYNFIFISEESKVDGDLLKLANDLKDEKNYVEILNPKDYGNLSEGIQNIINNSMSPKIKEMFEGRWKAEDYIIEPNIIMDLGNNFKPISNLKVIKENEKDTSKYLVQTNKKIVYKNEGNYKYKAIPGEIEIEFKVKVDTKEIGYIKFDPSKFEYINILGGKKTQELLTPIFEIEGLKIKDLTHGLYLGLGENNKIIHEVEDGKRGIEISSGAIVNFGASFKTSRDKVENIVLEVDKNLIILNEFIVYKLNKGLEGSITLEEIKDVSISNNLSNNNEPHKVKIDIKDIKNNNEEVEVIIVYKAKIPPNQYNKDLKNTIRIDDLDKDTKIYTSTNPEKNDGSETVIPGDGGNDILDPYNPSLPNLF